MYVVVKMVKDAAYIFFRRLITRLPMRKMEKLFAGMEELFIRGRYEAVRILVYVISQMSPLLCLSHDIATRTDAL